MRNTGSQTRGYRGTAHFQTSTRELRQGTEALYRAYKARKEKVYGCGRVPELKQTKRQRRIQERAGKGVP